MDGSENRGRFVIKRRYFIALILILLFPNISYALDVTWGAQEEFDSDTVIWTRVVEIGSNKFAIAWRENQTGNAIVGSVSGTDITYGSPVQFVADLQILSQDNALGLAKIDTDKFVVAYADDDQGDDGYARVTTVTGDEIDGFGTALEFANSDVEHISACQVATDKFAIVYADEADGQDAKARVGTAIGGTAITYGGIDEYDSAGGLHNECSQLDTDKFIVCYRRSDDTNGDSLVYTVATRELTEGGHLNFSTDVLSGVAWGWPIATDQVDTDKFVVAWHDTAEIYKARIGTVATTTISYDETATTVNEDTLSTVIGIGVVVIDTSNVLFFYNIETINGTASNLASISGSAMTMSGEEVTHAFFTGWPDIATISTNKVVNAVRGKSGSSTNGNAQIGDADITPPPATGAPQVIMIMSEKERKEKQKQWVLAKFKEDYASGKIKE